MLSSTGETVLAVVFGLVAIVVGAAMWRYREPYHRLIVQWQQHTMGERLGRKASRGSSPDQIKVFAALFVVAGVALVVAAPWIAGD